MSNDQCSGSDKWGFGFYARIFVVSLLGISSMCTSTGYSVNDFPFEKKVDNFVYCYVWTAAYNTSVAYPMDLTTFTIEL